MKRLPGTLVASVVGTVDPRLSEPLRAEWVSDKRKVRITEILISGCGVWVQLRIRDRDLP